MPIQRNTGTCSDSIIPCCLYVNQELILSVRVSIFVIFSLNLLLILAQIFRLPLQLLALGSSDLMTLCVFAHSPGPLDLTATCPQPLNLNLLYYMYMLRVHGPVHVAVHQATSQDRQECGWQHDIYTMLGASLPLCISNNSCLQAWSMIVGLKVSNHYWHAVLVQ